jgi:fatty acid-binding protein DegV
VRTSSRAFERLVDYARQRHESGADAWVVQHISAQQQADALVERCGEIFECPPEFVSEIGPVISAHAGPGLLGVGSISQQHLR